MRQYQVTDENNVTYCYEASDLRMALVVHHQVRGTEPVRAEEVRDE